ncbi:RusA family crossover junction endodeoxyribonuclease [Paenibacillus sp. P32E]|uniref:RusA family crossover junction endodeoxyribonuclease n=1 Tax=Paenibacillus sp. P32E TaxID=1349434 RepID=UPI0015C1614D|nr:RusA family crossover junction endodeoxyribonuclease [Paenibacillus sp. P32E]
MGAVRMTQRGKWKDKAALRYLAYKDFLGLEARKHIQIPFQTPIIITADFYYKIPSDFRVADKKLAREGKKRPAVKPDIDNVAKALMDALNKIAYRDDNQVVGLHTNKYYADEAKIVIHIEEWIA